jgi:hypothetical protein
MAFTIISFVGLKDYGSQKSKIEYTRKQREPNPLGVMKLWHQHFGIKSTAAAIKRTSENVKR